MHPLTPPHPPKKWITFDIKQEHNYMYIKNKIMNKSEYYIIILGLYSIKTPLK